MAEAILRELEELWAAEASAEGAATGTATGEVTWELEVGVGDGELSHPSSQLETIESVLTSLPDCEPRVLPEKLEIILVDGDYAGWSIHIDGIERIRTFCETDNPWLVPHSWHQVVLRDARRLPDDFCMRLKSNVVNERIETAETMADIPRTWWATTRKLYRLKKTFEHVHSETGIVYQVDLVRNMSAFETLRDAQAASFESSETDVKTKVRWNKKDAAGRRVQDRPRNIP